MEAADDHDTCLLMVVAAAAVVLAGVWAGGWPSVTAGRGGEERVLAVAADFVIPVGAAGYDPSQLPKDGEGARFWWRGAAPRPCPVIDQSKIAYPSSK
jgi:hypothetical protein